MDGATERVADGGGDAALEAADVDEGRPEDEGSDDEQGESDVEESAAES